MSVRLVSKIITSASSDAAITMMVMNLVSERRDSTAERSSWSRRISSSAMNFEVSMIAKPMMISPTLSRSPSASPCSHRDDHLPRRVEQQQHGDQQQEAGRDDEVGVGDPAVELAHRGTLRRTRRPGNPPREAAGRHRAAPRAGSYERAALEGEAGLHDHLVVADLAVVDVPADLDDLEPAEVPQRVVGAPHRGLDRALDAVARGADELDDLVDMLRHGFPPVPCWPTRTAAAIGTAAGEHRTLAQTSASPFVAGTGCMPAAARK